MKKKLIIFFILVSSLIIAQERWQDRASETLQKTSGIEDRAGGLHNVGNIGLFFENRGKLYPRRITQGPSGEFPINSGKHYIYRINPMVGIPGNVIQARYTDNEEWEAVGGYHNNELAFVATSDNTSTWPEDGWPVKDKNGNPVIKSQQDTYCIYDDVNNSRKVLDIALAQTGYSYGINFAQNIIFYKYNIINNSANNYTNLYFGLYIDLDIGNISGGDPEYGDDRIDFIKEKNFLYFSDDGISNEWEGNKTGMMGVAFIKTPIVDGKELGITDMHYNLYFDDEDQDSIQYGIMSSSQSLFDSPLSGRYFHIGNNADIHYDDPSTIPSSGLDIVANIASGPYEIGAGDTLTFFTAIIAGENYEEMIAYLDNAYTIQNFDFEISKPPLTPNLTGVAGDSKNTLFWDDLAESSIDNFSGIADFEGYRLYRSIDEGINWEKIAEYNIKNASGLQYSYTDETVLNGFEYWYSITSFDKGDSVTASLESPKGTNSNAQNLVILKPLSSAAGYSPVSPTEVIYAGAGNSNYSLTVEPVNLSELADHEYKVTFDYVFKREEGKLKTDGEIIITDSNQTSMIEYGIHFLSNRTYELINLALDEVIEPSPRVYLSDRQYKLNNGLSVLLRDPDPNDLEHLPKEGDLLTVRFAVRTVKNNSDTVMYPRRFLIDQIQATTDGVVFKMTKPNLISDFSRIGGEDKLDLSFEVVSEDDIINKTYLIKVKANDQDGVGNKFISLDLADAADNSLIATFDSLYNRDYFSFNGIEGRIEFDNENPPDATNIFSITTIIPVEPNLLDAYQFGINPPVIDKNREKEDINKIKVVPNPYIVSSLYEPEFGELRREPLRQIQFINLPTECTISIFTVDADLVKTIRHESSSGTAIWDLRAEGGREVAPGIYIYLVKTKETEFLNRFAIIK
jgi:hypothetical protein